MFEKVAKLVIFGMIFLNLYSLVHNTEKYSPKTYTIANCTNRHW